MMSSEMNHMELVDKGETICEKCGTRYNTSDQSPPEDATFHWVPNCPDCGSYMTTNPTDKAWLHIIGSRLDAEDENYAERVGDLNAYARLYHGRMVGHSAEELVELAKWFDRQAITGTPFGPRFYRPIAFALRKQARQKLMN